MRSAPSVQHRHSQRRLCRAGVQLLELEEQQSPLERPTDEIDALGGSQDLLLRLPVVRLERRAFSVPDDPVGKLQPYEDVAHGRLRPAGDPEGSRHRHVERLDVYRSYFRHLSEKDQE